MNTFVQNKLDDSSFVQQDNDCDQAFQIQSTGQANDSITKFQKLADQSDQVSQLVALQETADSSPNTKQTIQLQSLADNRQSQVVQRNPLLTAGRAFARKAAPMAAKGLAYGSGAATVAGAGSALSGIYENGKKNHPDHPLLNSETAFDMSREVIVTALGFASGPLGKIGGALSMADNLYDSYKAGSAALEDEKSPLNIESFEAFAKAETDKFRFIKNFGVFGKLLDTGMGIEKIMNNREALQNRFTDFHHLILQAKEEE